MRVRANIQVNGRPLRHAYVEHIVLGIGTNMYITDLEGRIRDNNFDEGIDSLTPNADIRVICQNPIVRVLDGDNLNIGVHQDVAITDGDTVNLNTNTEQDDHYALLNRVHLAYDVAFRPLRYFANLPKPDFPLGRSANLRATRDQAKRIDVIYPDYSVAPLAWVEPKRLGDNFPLMHIKRREIDTRLFGEGGAAPTLIPHEISHALHFAMLTDSQRGRAQDEYADFILTSPISGVGPFHNFTALTTPEVAYIEAGGFFGENFVEFMRAMQPGASTLVQPEQITEETQASFVLAEWNRLTAPSFLAMLLAVFTRFGNLIRARLGRFTNPSPPSAFPLRQGNRQLVRPTVTGGAVEGAVYAAIFVDFAASVGLDFAASSYFAANAITFGEYRAHINSNHPEHAQTLEAVRSFWRL